MGNAWRRNIVLTMPSILLTAALLLPGCEVGPDYHSPKTTMPVAWLKPATAPSTAPTTQSSLTVAAPAKLANWWTTFDDPELNSLISRAIDSNLDLRQAEARLRQARAVRGVVAAGFWPQANATGSYQRSRNVSTVNSAGQVVPNSKDAGSNLYQAGFDASWELDVFGGVRRGIESADFSIQAAVEDRRDTLVTLLSEVAVDYIDIRGYQQQIVIAEQNLRSEEQTLALTRRRFRGGLAAGLDEANAQAQVATTAAQIPPLKTSVDQTIYSLSVLLGREPAALTRELSQPGAIPPVPPQVPVGLPSDLLRQRPDIRRCEQQLAAATAQIGVAAADLFPKFTLNGQAGMSANTFSGLGNWNNHNWSFGPSVTWNIFNAGQVQSNIEVQNALQQQALITYQQTVLSALQDVESALVAYRNEQSHQKTLAESVTANIRAVDLANKLYVQGLTNFLNVLIAQQSLYASQNALVQSQSLLSTDLVAIYKALGGGWEVSPWPATTRK